MENINKKILIALATLVSFLISFIFFYNDLISYLIISGTITVVLFIYLCIVVFKKKSKKSDYDIKLKRILKTYDSILVYSNLSYEIDEENITFVKNIDELVRYCDELNKTIVYIQEDESSTFILKNKKELLVYIMKKDEYSRSDMEQKIHKYLRDSGR